MMTLTAFVSKKQQKHFQCARETSKSILGMFGYISCEKEHKTVFKTSKFLLSKSRKTSENITMINRTTGDRIKLNSLNY